MLPGLARHRVRGGYLGLPLRDRLCRARRFVSVRWRSTAWWLVRAPVAGSIWAPPALSSRGGCASASSGASLGARDDQPDRPEAPLRACLSTWATGPGSRPPGGTGPGTRRRAACGAARPSAPGRHRGIAGPGQRPACPRHRSARPATCDLRGTHGWQRNLPGRAALRGLVHAGPRVRHPRGRRARQPAARRRRRRHRHRHRRHLVRYLTLAGNCRIPASTCTANPDQDALRSGPRTGNTPSSIMSLSNCTRVLVLLWIL